MAGRKNVFGVFDSRLELDQVFLRPPVTMFAGKNDQMMFAGQNDNVSWSE